MATKYAAHVSTKQTPQTEPIPGKPMVKNSTGGFIFELDDWGRLDRFLVLGADGGTYYASERKLTRENAACVLRCLKDDGFRTVTRIAEISKSGRAPKNDPAIFALALAFAHGDNATKAEAAKALPDVCRIGTHLFSFASTINELRGWGRSVRRAVGEWYTGKKASDLAYQCVKYQQRDGWSHRDLLRLSHPKAEGLVNDVIHWAVKGWPNVGDDPHPEAALSQIWAMEKAKRATTKQEIVKLIREYRLVRECVPTQFLTEADVWDALLAEMPLAAMVRNLATMTRVGLLAPLSSATAKVVAELGDAERLKKSRLHPVAALAALLTYQQGHGERGKSAWTPVGQVVDALDAAFYAAFGNVEPAGKRFYLGVDVSGSMWGSAVSGVPGLTAGIGAAAMALVTAATERQHHFAAFNDAMVPFDASQRERLAAVANRMRALPWGRTDCALPMLDAIKRKMPVDVFCVYTDNETYAGGIHPTQALSQYRQATGIPAKMVVCGMTATEFTIADSSDAGQLDVVGFSADTPQLLADFARQ